MLFVVLFFIILDLKKSYSQIDSTKQSLDLKSEKEVDHQKDLKLLQESLNRFI